MTSATIFTKLLFVADVILESYLTLNQCQHESNHISSLMLCPERTDDFSFRDAIGHPIDGGDGDETASTSSSSSSSAVAAGGDEDLGRNSVEM